MSRGSSRQRSHGVSRFDYSRVTVEFESAGVDCVGSLFDPDRSTAPPVVVVAPGPVADRTVGLPAFAREFAARGIAAFTFDYRHSGASGGEPRALVDPERQVADVRAAVSAARDLDRVDGNRLALWGAGLGGGHVLRAAAGDWRVDAVVAQFPVVDGRGLAWHDSMQARVRAVVAWARDAVGGRLGRPHTVPVVGDAASGAMLTAPGARSAVSRLVGDTSWENAVLARSYRSLVRYRPLDTLTDLKCPVLFVAGDRDEIVAPESVAEAAAATPGSTFLRLPVGHFDVYAGRAFERAFAHQIAFLDAELR